MFHTRFSKSDQAIRAGRFGATGRLLVAGSGAGGTTAARPGVRGPEDAEETPYQSDQHSVIGSGMSAASRAMRLSGS